VTIPLPAAQNPQFRRISANVAHSVCVVTSSANRSAAAAVLVVVSTVATVAPRSATAPGGVFVVRSSSVDTAALVAFQRRDDGAVRTLYREYGRLVYAVAHRVLGQHELAEEATQQTFVNAWRAADRIDVDRDPSSWLATIAKRAAIDIYRRESRRSARAIDDVPTDDRALVTLPPDMGTLDSVWHVRRAIDALPAEEATIVRMQHLEGMTQSEISEQLGIALGTVKSRSHRAHQKLAALLGHLRGEAHD
jgi:RNA polymerase sigma factor (sigma-70 family)